MILQQLYDLAELVLQRGGHNSLHALRDSLTFEYPYPQAASMVFAQRPHMHKSMSANGMLPLQVSPRDPEKPAPANASDERTFGEPLLQASVKVPGSVGDRVWTHLCMQASIG